MGHRLNNSSLVGVIQRKSEKEKKIIGKKRKKKEGRKEGDKERTEKRTEKKENMAF